MMLLKRIVSGTFLALKQQAKTIDCGMVNSIRQSAVVNGNLANEPFRSLQTTLSAGFAFKTFPKMFGTQYKKGHLNCRSRTKNTSWKRGYKVVKRPYHQTANNALMKRIKIVGPAYDRKLKFKGANHRHQLRKKSRACLKRKKRARYAHSTDFKRLRRLIPLLKRAGFKANH